MTTHEPESDAMTYGMRFRGGVVSLLLIAGAGCGGEPEFVPVRGTVTLDGQALIYKDVEFVPEPGTPGIGARGNTMTEGVYNLVAVRSGAVTETYGVQPGSYRVVVCEPRFGAPDGSIPEVGSDDKPVPAIGAEGPSTRRAGRPKQLIPTVYTKADTTPLRIEVLAGGGPFDFALKSKP